MKRCSKCGESKLKVNYTKRTRSVDGLQNQCKQCTNARLAVYRKDKPAVATEVSRRSSLKRYGLTIDSFEDILEEQGSSCAICFRPLHIPKTSGKSKYAVDHNHSTGEVRGILCPPCNMGIGSLQDNPVILRSAARYLETRGHYGC